MAPVVRPGISAFTLLGLTNPVAYVAGLSMTAITQTVTNAGISYSPIASALPFTTSGTFETIKFQAVKGITAGDLAVPNGSSKVVFVQPTANAQSRTSEKKMRDVVSIGDFGGLDDWDGTAGTNNYLALLRIYNDYPNGCTIVLPKLGTGIYMSNGAQYAAPKNGYVLVPDLGVSIYNMGGSIPILAAGVQVSRPLKIRNTTAQITQDNGPQDFKQVQDKASFLNAANGEAAKLKFISHLFATQLAVTWPNGPVATAAPFSNTADTTTWSANAAGFNLTTFPLRPGSVLSGYLADNAAGGAAYAGSWMAGVITDAGFSIVRQDASGGSLIVSVKSGTAAIVESGLTPPTTPSLTYRMLNALVAIRIHTPTSYSVLFNGIEVARIADAGGAILSAGLGAGFAQNANPAIVAGMSISQGEQSMGVQPQKIVIVGDSTSDPGMGCSWSDYLRQYLSGAGGSQFLSIKNIAISGDTSTQQLNRLTATTIAGYNYCLIQIGINDIQTGAPVQTLISNVTAMVAYCKNNLVIPIVGVPAMWYGQAEAMTAGNVGNATTNKEKGSPYRATLLRYLANAGVAVHLGSLSDYGAVIPELLNQPSIDSIVYDNIHPTSYGRMVMGNGWAKTLLGQIVPKATKALASRPMLASWFASNYAAAQIPDYSIDFDALRICGLVAATADPTSGQTMFTLPEVLRPTSSSTQIVSTASSSGVPSGTAFIQIGPSGLAQIYGAAAGTRYIYFSGSSIQLSP